MHDEVPLSYCLMLLGQTFLQQHTAASFCREPDWIRCQICAASTKSMSKPRSLAPFTKKTFRWRVETTQESPQKESWNQFEITWMVQCFQMLQSKRINVASGCLSASIRVLTFCSISGSLRIFLFTSLLLQGKKSVLDINKQAAQVQIDRPTHTPSPIGGFDCPKNHQACWSHP